MSETKEIIEQEIEAKEVPTIIGGYRFTSPEGLSRGSLPFWEYKQKSIDCVLEHYKPYIVERIKTYIIQKGKDNTSVSDNVNDYAWKLTFSTPENIRHEKIEGRWVLENIHTGFTVCAFTLRESGNCCGSVTIHGIRIYSPLNSSKRGIIQLLMSLIEDFAVAQASSSIIMLNPTCSKFTNNLINEYKYNVIDTFVNVNTSREIAILSKKPIYSPGEEIIIKDYYYEQKQN